MKLIYQLWRMRLKSANYLFLVSFFFLSCTSSYHPYIAGYTFRNPSGTPDYSNLDHWAAHPDKKDPSDSVPSSLKANYHPDTAADVFFIHPTTYTDKERSFGWNAPIDNPELNAKTDYSTILFQASIFNEVGRIYSPRYRQASLSSYYPKTSTDTLEALASFELAYLDIKAAFNYYLQQYHKGRPIIIASHSQGTTHAKRLLKEFFDGKALEKNLVAAYLVGMAVEPDFLKTIQPCKTPEQTGCICSWRTYKQGYKPPFVQAEKFTAIVTNPLTWTDSLPAADRSWNKGGVLLNYNKPIEKLVNATISNGVLWTDKPHFFGSIFYTTKNYHVADMNFFYKNIRENAALRTASFLKK